MVVIRAQRSLFRTGARATMRLIADFAGVPATPLAHLGGDPRIDRPRQACSARDRLLCPSRAANPNFAMPPRFFLSFIGLSIALLAQSEPPKDSPLDQTRAGVDLIGHLPVSTEDPRPLLRKFDTLRVSDVIDALQSLGLQDSATMDHSIRPLWRDETPKASHRFCGVALTLRFVPTNRPRHAGASGDLRGVQALAQPLVSHARAGAPVHPADPAGPRHHHRRAGRGDDRLHRLQQLPRLARGRRRRRRDQRRLPRH